MSEFKSTIIWNASHRLCKLIQKTDKNGNMWLLGDFNKTFKITIRQMPVNQWTKPGTWEMNLVPVKFEKIQQNYQQQQGYQQQPNNYQQQVPNNFKNVQEEFDANLIVNDIPDSEVQF